MIAEVIVDIAHAEVDKIFDYITTPDIQKGQRVVIPFGKRNIEGYVIGFKEHSDIPPEKLKTIIRPLDKYPIITEEFLQLSDFLIQKNHLKRVDTLRLFLPSGMRKERVKPLIENIILVETFDINTVLTGLRANSKNQIALLKSVKAQERYKKSELNKKFGASAVNKFLGMGILTETKEHINRVPFTPSKENKEVQLTTGQSKIFQEVEEVGTHLIFGVTGSGKTEIYMRCISRCLQQNKGAIMLVPEIGLTPQIFGLFKARFGERVAILHSGLSSGERFDEWQRIRKGEADIVVGARSAIFAPLQNIGVIIIDEEHDGSYKSESNPRFYTHDVAQFRAKYNNCPLILGSATPSVESFHQAESGEYKLHQLPVRINHKDMPKVQIVNMCNELNAGNSGMFSAQLQLDLKDCLNSGNQAMLFCNRRGFASFMVCRECGWTAKCEDCDSALVYHKEDNRLKCHFCNRRYKAFTNCPNCNSAYIRMGSIGTQQVAEQLRKMFPEVKIFRMDFDTTQSKMSHAQILEEFSKTKPSILVGTQMIAKGHDFPNITLVGIVNADMSLHFSDFRSTERTFQLLTQVAGRAGRADKIGKIILQTYAPNHPVYHYMANYSYKAFFEQEINIRKTAKFPPFAQIIRILASGKQESEVRDVVAKMYKELDALYMADKEVLFCQAMKSPVKRIQNRFRYQILMRLGNKGADSLLEKIYNIVDKYTVNSVSVFVEINPNNMS